MSEDGERIARLHGIASELGVDVGGDALSIVHEIRSLLGSIVDEGTSLDTGGGMGEADMWLTVSGKEYLMTVRPTGR